MQSLKGMHWNGEDFRDSTNHLFVEESMREQCLHFIALLETEDLTLLCLS
jgi:hypothetical protein